MEKADKQGIGRSNTLKTPYCSRLVLVSPKTDVETIDQIRILEKKNCYYKNLELQENKR